MTLHVGGDPEDEYQRAGGSLAFGACGCCASAYCFTSRWQCSVWRVTTLGPGGGQVGGEEEVNGPLARRAADDDEPDAGGRSERVPDHVAMEDESVDAAGFVDGEPLPALGRGFGGQLGGAWAAGRL